MKRLLIITLFCACFSVGFAAGEMPINMYSQLIGFTSSGQYFFYTQMSDWGAGLFLETVLDSWIGVEIHLAQVAVPFSTYSGNTGTGRKDFYQFGAGVRHYLVSWNPTLSPFFAEIGLDYNQFSYGYHVYNNNTSYAVINRDGNNFLDMYIGGGMTAHITKEIYTQLGFRLVWDFKTGNEAMGLKLFLSFAYGN